MKTQILNFIRVLMAKEKLYRITLKLHKIDTDIKKNALSSRELDAENLVHNTCKIFLEKYGNDSKKILVFHEKTPWRFSPAYPGEKPIRHEMWPINKLLPIISINRETGLFLLLICARLQPKKVLEVGSGYGVSALYILAGSHNNSKLTCIEKSDYYCEYIPKILSSLQKKFELINGDCLLKTGQTEFIERTKYDVIFVDALHQKQFNLELFKNLLVITSVGGIIIFDDIRWSTQMSEMWEEVRLNSRVFHSFEFNRFGILLLK